jgi:hypothetical protein
MSRPHGTFVHFEGGFGGSFGAAASDSAGSLFTAGEEVRVFGFFGGDDDTS